MKRSKRKIKKPGLICENRRALHNYVIEKQFEAGIVLEGTEVKAIREGKANIADAYSQIKGGEAYLVNMHIAPYDKASHFNHEPGRTRKLLMKKSEITRLSTKVNERGYALIPLDLHYSNGFVKVTVALAKGKKQYDNRQQILAKQQRREMQREKARKFSYD